MRYKLALALAFEHIMMSCSIAHGYVPCFVMLDDLPSAAGRKQLNAKYAYFEYITTTAAGKHRQTLATCLRQSVLAGVSLPIYALSVYLSISLAASMPACPPAYLLICVCLERDL